jgi:hypothetical protein
MMGVAGQPGPNPLFSPAWQEFNLQQRGMRPLPVTYSLPGKRFPRLSGVLYLNRSGKVIQPRVNPYLPFVLESEQQSPRQAARDWLTLAPLLANELLRRGLHSSMTLPASFTDGRPFQWAGLRCGVYYTFVIHFPFSLERVGSDVRRRISKARSLGYNCNVEAPAVDALACINESETRKGFGYRVELPALEQLRAALGPLGMRCYVTYSSEGRPAAAFVSLIQPGGTAYAFLTGSASWALSSGATQLTICTMLQDLQALGVACFDYVGAFNPSVSAAKAQWGGELVSHLNIEQISLRNLARDAWYMLRLRRQGRP